MKKFFKATTLIVLLLAMSIFALAACDDSVSEISVDENGMPQLVYVLGADMDLSNGILTVKDKDTTTEIPMNSEGVTVSGYDKTKLGEQTVTISYGNQSTQIKVTVVERMQAVDYVADYLVGDQFNNSKGRLKITRDDGSSYTVYLNSNKVTVTGFNSSSAASELPVKATYEVDGEVYEANFKVNIHPVDSVVLHKPNKIAYNSHETALELAGGYLVLSGNGGKLERDVPLTDESVTISGFNLKAVNPQNTPLTQTVTVIYDEKEYTYDIKLTYTDISMFNDNVSKFADLDWSGEDVPEISNELGALALELMDLYADLSKAERTAIKAEDSLNVARAALTYGYDLWYEDFLSFEDAFGIDYYYGELVLYCNTYEAVLEAVDGLKDNDRPLYSVSPTLTSIIELFGEEEYFDGYNFAAYSVIDNEIYESILDVFEHMLDFYDCLIEIPENWQTVGVEACEDEIESVYSFMMNSEYIDSYYNQIYEFACDWREEVDTFDVLYTYYYNADDMDSLKELAKLSLPSALDELVSNINVALTMMDELETGFVFDTSDFFYGYFTAKKLAEDIKNGADGMIKDLYNELPINTIFGFGESVSFHFDTIIEYLRVSTGGFCQLSAALLEVVNYNLLIEKYVDVLGKVFDDADYENSAQYATDVEEMFALFLSLTPTEQNTFLTILHPYYVFGAPQYAFENTEDYEELVSPFSVIINNYYLSKFTSDAGKAAYIDLLVALEIYGQRFLNEDTWFEDLTARIESVDAALEDMSADDLAAFDTYLSAIYATCNGVLTKFGEDYVKIELGEWQDEFDALSEAVMNMELAYYLMEEGVYVYNLFFSAYERAMTIVDYIILNAPQSIVDAFYHEALYVLEVDPEEGTEDGVTKVEWSYDYVLAQYRSIYVNLQLAFMGETNIYDTYKELNLGEFLNKIYDLVWPYLYSDPEDTETVVFDKNKVTDVLYAFTQLSIDAQTMFVLMEGETTVYYLALDYFFTEAFTENAAEVAYKLVEAEQKYLMCIFTGDDSEVEALEDALVELKALYEDLEGDDKTSFAELEATYAADVEEFEAFLEAIESESGAEDDAA